MKKILIVKIIKNVDVRKEKICLVASEIHCHPSDEASIKQSIETTRNPGVLTAIITQGMSRSSIMEIKSDLDHMRENITVSDRIEAGFLSMDGCDGTCEKCILHNVAEKLNNAFLYERLDITHPCQN